MAAQEYDPSAVSEEPAGEGQDRVAKVIARAGVASRREVERLIEAGRVAINGRVLTSPAVKVEADDVLTVDGVMVASAEPTRLFRYHKPVGLMTTHTDPKGRPTVFASLPPELPRLISVGRLDVNSEGLLLLTNDGGLTRALELPSTGWARVYRARAYGDTTQEKLNRLRDGVTIEGVRYGPIEAKLDKASGRNIWITVTLSEGKNREVRRVLESLGLQVNRLLRLAYGPFSLSTLAPGHIEEVGPRVIRELLADHIDPANMPTGNAVEYRAPASAQTRRDPVKAAAMLKPAEKPDKPVYKPGWAKPKKKAVSHVMPKPAKTRVVADFGPGARDLKPRPFKSNAPKAEGDRISKGGKAGPERAPPRDLRPKHFKDRDAAPPASAKTGSPKTASPKTGAPRPIPGEDDAIAAKARAFRLALEGLEDDRGGKPRAGPKTGAPRPGKTRAGPARAGRPGSPQGEARGESKAGPAKFAAPKGKGHWFTAPGETPTTRPPLPGKTAPGRGGKPGGKPVGGKPAGARPTGAKPVGAKPAGPRPAGPRPAGPRAGKPSGGPKGRK